MWTLLAWLWDKAVRVYAWFGYLWAGAINVIENVYDWAVAAVVLYYGYAKAWAITKRDEAITWANGLYNTTVTLIGGALTAAKTYANSLITSVEAYANAAVTSAKDTIWGWVEAAKTWAWNWVEAGKTVAWGWVEAAKSLIVTWAAPIVSLFPWLSNFIPWLTPTKQGRVDDVTGTGYPTLATFMRDPIGTVMAILKPYFVTLFCFAMAYALGTVEATLPPWPVWGGGGEAPPGPGPTPPPPGAGRLGKPVVPLYISGYIFRPGHWATDFGLVNGQPVFASHDGTVETVGWQPTGLGLYVTVRGTDWWTLYAHCQASNVSQGQVVSTGQAIAEGDDTGLSTGPHLHFVCKYRGLLIDPVLAIGM